MTIPAPKTVVAPREWRADLQGLRVVAILLVASYHVWFGRVSGGVDVFLMLSGFFVGGSLWRRFEAGRPPKAKEYLARQGRRLLPTAIVVLFATLVAFVVIMPRSRWFDGAWETLASLFYVQNWWLIAQGQQYGAADPNQSPWQQFWSMSAQGQFFILIPLMLALIWVIVRRYQEPVRQRALAWSVIIVTIASFAIAIWWVNVDQPVAYYSTFARVWEFTVGMLLAMLLERWKPASKLWQPISWIAITALFATGILIDGRATFPGAWALVPIGAATLLVISGAAPHGWGVPRILGYPWIAAAGKYAYAFYLWHWPILILFTAWRGQPSGWKVGFLIMGVSAILAILTYHLVEAPLRESTYSPSARQRSRFALVSIAAAAALVVVAPVVWSATILVQRAEAFSVGETWATHPGARAITQPEIYGNYSPAVPLPRPEDAKSDLSKLVLDGCSSPKSGTEVLSCSYVDGAGPRVALFGGSHSEHWFEVALHMAHQYDWTLVPFVKAACPPYLPEDAADPDCATWLTSVYDELAHGGFDMVITTATRPHPSGDVVPSEYVRMLETLAQHSIVLGVRDNPAFEFDMVDCFSLEDDCNVPLNDRLSKMDPTEAQKIPGVVFVDTNDLICPEGVCRPVVGNRMVFRDTSHLTASYVLSLADEASLRWADALSEVPGLPGH